MSAEAMGPTYAGGVHPVVQGAYSVLYLPDVNNRALQEQGRPPVFYYFPRMARKNGPAPADPLSGPIRFAGTGSDGDTDGSGHMVDGILTFFVTGALPHDVRTQAEAQITQRFRGSSDALWGISSSRPPVFCPAVISSSTKPAATPGARPAAPSRTRPTAGRPPGPVTRALAVLRHGARTTARGIVGGHLPSTSR